MTPLSGQITFRSTDTILECMGICKISCFQDPTETVHVSSHPPPVRYKLEPGLTRGGLRLPLLATASQIHRPSAPVVGQRCSSAPRSSTGDPWDRTAAP